MYCLHGDHNDHRMAFEQIGVPEVAASIGFPAVVAAVDGGQDSYWHLRQDGTDALAMLLDEFVPLVRDRVTGPLPQAIMGWSIGRLRRPAAAERTAGRAVSKAAARLRAVAPPAQRSGSPRGDRPRLARSTARPSSSRHDVVHRRSTTRSSGTEGRTWSARQTRPGPSCGIRMS